MLDTPKNCINWTTEEVGQLDMFEYWTLENVGTF